MTSSNLLKSIVGCAKKQGVDARFVLFSPIAYENTGNPNLPDGQELNANLKAIFTQATENAPPTKRVRHLLTCIPADFRRCTRRPKSQLTLNGIHLNAAGYTKSWPDVIARTLDQQFSRRRPSSLAMIYQRSRRQELALAQSLSRDRWKRYLGIAFNAQFCRRPNECGRAGARIENARFDDRQPRCGDLGAANGQSIEPDDSPMCRRRSW